MPRRNPRSNFNSIWFAVAICGFLHTRAFADPPIVDKIDPPFWWAGHSINPVRVLLHGANLGQARIEIGPGIRPSRISINAVGTYAFADLTISTRAAAGSRTLRVVTPQGMASAKFELLPKLTHAGRFQGFGPDDLIYLIMPDRFANGDPSNDDPSKSKGLFDRAKPRFYHGGDLRGVQQHLPYLKDLGVTALWLTPWYDNVDHLNEREKYTSDNKLDRSRGRPITDYHGYGATDLYAVEEHLGDLKTLRELVDAAHSMGLKVIQDQVANHVGPYHPWVADSPTPTWFNGTVHNHLENTWQTWTIPDPHSSTSAQKQTLEGWFVNLLPDLNQSDSECRRYLIQNAVWWVDATGVDGVREDTLPYVPRAFWRDWSAALKKEHPGLTLLGEMFDGDAAKVSFFQGGQSRFDGVDSGIDALFDFPLYYQVRSAFAEGHSLKPLAEQLARDHLYVNANNLVTFVGLHDVDRFMNVRGADAEGLKLAFTFLMTTRGIPLIYYGDEIAMRGGGDPDNRRDFPGGWTEDPKNAFLPSGRSSEEENVWKHVQKLASLRKTSRALRQGRLTHLGVTEHTYAYARTFGPQTAIVVLNNDSKAQTLDVPVEVLPLAEGANLTDALGSGAVDIRDGKIRVTLEAKSAAILF
jgi:glycosidase